MFGLAMKNGLNMTRINNLFEYYLSLTLTGLEGHICPSPVKGLEGHICRSVVTSWWRHCDVI